jgi:hypothetical protein
MTRTWGRSFRRLSGVYLLYIYMLSCFVMATATFCSYDEACGSQYSSTPDLPYRGTANLFRKPARSRGLAEAVLQLMS